MKEIITYLMFDGNTREAMTFYAKAFGAELQIMPFSDMPDMPEAAKSAKDRVMHARLAKGSTLLMASDTMPGHPFQQGNNFSISVQCESVQEIDKLFAALGEKGQITMPLQQTFWAARFGMLKDQFGVAWMFNLEQSK
jgi:PhnB protein